MKSRNTVFQCSFILGPLLWVNIILSSLNTCRFSFFYNDIGNRSDNSAIKQGENLLMKLYNI